MPDCTMHEKEKNGSCNSGLARASERFLTESVGRAMQGYELRQSQLDMMHACCSILEAEGTLLAEAGTGTGKTFAYLVPIILSGKRALVSTRTINLQEQIVSKDLKFLSGLIEFDYAIAKGRGNYLCLRRLQAFRANDEKEAGEYRGILNWVRKSKTGDIVDYNGMNSSGRSNNLNRLSIWDRVCSDADACKGLKCGLYGKCFYFSAREKWEKAQVVVANHALVGINAMLAGDAKILPAADVLVADEAHALDHVLSEVAGITLSNRGFDYILSRFLRPDEKGTYKGLLSQSPHLFTEFESLKTEMGLFWIHVRNAVRHRETIRGRFALKELMAGLAGTINAFIEKIRTSTTGLFQEDDELELKAAIIKLQAFAGGMEEFNTESPDKVKDSVRWADIEENRIALRMSPVYPRDFVVDSIVPEYRAMILTSATLSVSGDFGFITKVLGLEESEKIAVPSPFDLREQVAVDIRRGINLKVPGSTEKLAKVIVEEASEKDGGVLVLFTSRDVMKRTWGQALEDLTLMDLNPMMQGEMPNRLMLEIMRESENSVIFGLDSFWEGVDVKGDALKCLIITKLPFEVPTEPIVKARTEEIDREGGNSFYEYSLPRAVLKFKQGFGRLIRSGSDRGRVVICDERIETMAYGRKFLESVF